MPEQTETPATVTVEVSSQAPQSPPMPTENAPLPQSLHAQGEVQAMQALLIMAEKLAKLEARLDLTEKTLDRMTTENQAVKKQLDDLMTAADDLAAEMEVEEPNEESEEGQENVTLIAPPPIAQAQEPVKVPQRGLLHKGIFGL